MFIGADVGQARDRAVLVIVRAAGPRLGVVSPRPRWRVEAVHTAPSAMPYPDLVRMWMRVVDVAASAWGSGYAAVDATGVGRAVVDMLREAGADTALDANLAAPQRLIAVTATGGTVTGPGAVRAGGAWPNVTVPAVTLREHLHVAYQQDAILIPPSGMAHREVLLAELDRFGTAARDDAGGHFDHVSALALAVWLGDHVATQLSERELRHAE